MGVINGSLLGVLRLACFGGVSLHSLSKSIRCPVIMRRRFNVRASRLFSAYKYRIPPSHLEFCFCFCVTALTYVWAIRGTFLARNSSFCGGLFDRDSLACPDLRSEVRFPLIRYLLVPFPFQFLGWTKIISDSLGVNEVDWTRGRRLLPRLFNLLFWSPFDVECLFVV